MVDEARLFVLARAADELFVAADCEEDARELLAALNNPSLPAEEKESDTLAATRAASSFEAVLIDI